MKTATATPSLPPSIDLPTNIAGAFASDRYASEARGKEMGRTPRYVAKPGGYDIVLSARLEGVVRNEIYALVFLARVTSPDGNPSAEANDDCGRALERHVLAHHKISNDQWTDFVGKESRRDFSGQSITNRLNQLTADCSDSASAAARIYGCQLYATCSARHVGLYKGPAIPGRIASRDAALPSPRGYRFHYMHLYW